MTDIESIKVNEEKGTLMVCFVSRPFELIWRGFYMTVGVFCAFGAMIMLGIALDYAKGFLSGLF